MMRNTAILFSVICTLSLAIAGCSVSGTALTADTSDATPEKVEDLAANKIKGLQMTLQNNRDLCPCDPVACAEADRISRELEAMEQGNKKIKQLPKGWPGY